MSEFPAGPASEREAPGPERRRSWAGVSTAIVLFVISVAVAIGSLDLGYWTSIGPGAGFFPLVLALILGGAAVTWGLAQFRGVEPEPASELESRSGTRSIITTVASLVVLAVLLEILGFQLSVLLFLFLHLRILGKQKWRVTIPLMILGSFGLYALFSNVLSVGLPTSSIPLLAGIGL